MPVTHHTTLYMEEKDLEQVVLQGLEIESIEKDKAAERKALTRKYGLKPEDAKYSQDTQGQTRDIVAEKLGISGKHWERMKFIYLHRDCLLENEYNNWRAGKVSTSKIYKEISEDLRYDDILNRMNILLTDMQFDVIDYESSYILVEIQRELLEALFNCRPKTKQDVMNSFDKLINHNKNFLDRRYDELSKMKMEVAELKRKLKFKTHNDI